MKVKEFINQIFKFDYPLYFGALLIIALIVLVFLIIQRKRILRRKKHEKKQDSLLKNSTSNSNITENQTAEPVKEKTTLSKSDNEKTIYKDTTDIKLTNKPENKSLEIETIIEKNVKEAKVEESYKTETNTENLNATIINEPESIYDTVTKKSERSKINEDKTDIENVDEFQSSQIIKPQKKRKNPRSLRVSLSKKSPVTAHEKNVLPSKDSLEQTQLLSEPNAEQTNDLTIKFLPNNIFQQKDPYQYPVVKMPFKNSYLKLPREGRSNSRGYEEKEFSSLLQKQITELEINTNCHMAIPSYCRPYEPDIVLYDKSINLYVDVEIDEPYDGYYRVPTHDLESKEDIRDLFFNESGWIVIRFTEKQVHERSKECILLIKSVLASLKNIDNNIVSNKINESQWDRQQAIRWEKQFYREKYLGIQSFGKHQPKTRIIVREDNEQEDPIEQLLNRTNIYNHTSDIYEISFDESNHRYFPITNKTGNADFISVTTLIDKFFPFDIKRYIDKKAKDENKTKAVILAEYEKKRDEAAEKGSYLHKQIENYFTDKPRNENFKEFRQFQQFYNTEIVPRNLKFIEAEKVISLKDYNIAGTIDALFIKSNNEYVIVDWKRSTKLLIDGHAKKYGFGMALSELSYLDNSSYYKYELQQSFYRYILEKEYNMKVSSMILTVLHEKYSEYGTIPLKYREKEVKIIINSLNHKI